MRRYGRLIAVAAFLVVLFIAAEMLGLRQHFSLTYLRLQFSDNMLGDMAVFALLFSLGNLIQIPGWIFLAAAVLALGRAWGGLATYVAASVSCVVTYGVVRYVGGDALRKLDSGVAQRILARLDAHPIRSVVLIRTLFQTLPAANYALAMSGIGFRNYIIGTLLGLPLPIAAYCAFFDYLAMFLHLG